MDEGALAHVPWVAQFVAAVPVLLNDNEVVRAVVALRILDLGIDCCNLVVCILVFDVHILDIHHGDDNHDTTVDVLNSAGVYLKHSQLTG